MSTASDRLALYIAAEAAILDGQEVRMENGHFLRMPDLKMVQDQILALRSEVAAEQRAAQGALGPVTMVAGFNPGFHRSREGSCFGDDR
jgi:hypothetical protein